jgi:hypothetical protein
MDADDDSLLLNLAGVGQAQAPAAKDKKRRSLWERRQEHRQRSSVIISCTTKQPSAVHLQAPLAT